MRRVTHSKRTHKKKEVLISKTVPQEVSDVIHLLATGALTAQDELKCYTSVQEVSHSVGLLPEDITTLVDVIGASRRSQKIRKKLVVCLIPNSSVEEEAVINAISYIINPNFSVSLQVELMKWICTVYTLISSTDRLSCLYSILFPILKSDLLQPYVCELLFKMTKEEHVLPYRIRALVDLQAQVGSQPHVLALLQLYANYRPDVVIVQCNYKNAFKSHGRVHRYITQVKQMDELPLYSKSTNAEALILKKEITSFAHLSEVLESLNGIVGISKLLSSPLRRILFSSNLPETFMMRLRMFLRIALFSDTSWVVSSWKYCSRSMLLPLISDISFELQEGIPDVCSFIAAYLEVWDGHRSREILLDLISYWEICPFADLLEAVLKPLYKYFCYSTMDFMCAVLACLTKMYKNWILFETPRLQARRESLSSSIRQMTVFEREVDLFEPSEQIEALSNYIDQLCIVSLQIHSNHPPVLLHQILRFYETVLLVQQTRTLPLLHIPPESVMCALVFSPNPYILSQVCGLICRYKNAVYVMKRGSASTLIPHVISSLNCYVSDLCNMLGICIAFSPSKTAKFFRQELPSEVAESIYKPQECFALYRHPATLGLAFTFLHSSTVELSPDMLLKEPNVRDMFFQYLESCGFSDIVVFLQTFISTF